jgi:two-component system, response regulator / RNA-binding antiterminator
LGARRRDLVARRFVLTRKPCQGDVRLQPVSDLDFPDRRQNRSRNGRDHYHHQHSCRLPRRQIALFDRRLVVRERALRRLSRRGNPLIMAKLATDLTVLVIDENAIRASIIEEGLNEAGHLNVRVIHEMQGVARLIETLDPDVIIIDIENPNRDMMEHMFQLSRSVSRPIAMFVDRSDSAAIEAAVDAGVSAYVVDGLKKERIKPILDMAVSRFNAFSRLQRELAEARNALEERKVIERAKGILMKMRGLGEEEAFALLRQTAMNEKKKLADIAQSVVTAASLLL